MFRLSMMSLLFSLIVLFGQTSVPQAFEVASVKEALPLSIEHIQGGQFHVGVSINGSRADYGYMSLADLIPYAYRVKRYQLSGPGWMNEKRWDILAKFPAGQPADRAPEMMQNLLAERFKLAIHRENREQSVYELVVGKGALKIKEAAAQEEVAGGDSGMGNVRMNNDGGRATISGGATGIVHTTGGAEWHPAADGENHNGCPCRHADAVHGPARCQRHRTQRQLPGHPGSACRSDERDACRTEVDSDLRPKFFVVFLASIACATS
jgi:hypothetical protein